MKKYPIAMLAITTLTSFNAVAGATDTQMPGPGIFALLALGVVGAIGISRLRK
jgi:hypothetical protein